MVIQYTSKVIEHFKNPHNIGKIEDADAYAVEGGPACGDQIAMYLKIDRDTKVITDIKFESFGCAANVATASIVTDMAKGKTIEEAMKTTWKRVAEELGGLPPIKMHCSIMAVDALKNALKNYLNKAKEK